MHAFIQPDGPTALAHVIPAPNAPFTVSELVRSGVPLDEACWIAWDQAPTPSALKEDR